MMEGLNRGLRLFLEGFVELLGLAVHDTDLIKAPRKRSLVRMLVGLGITGVSLLFLGPGQPALVLLRDYSVFLGEQELNFVGIARIISDVLKVGAGIGVLVVFKGILELLNGLRSAGAPLNGTSQNTKTIILVVLGGIFLFVELYLFFIFKQA